MTEPNPRMKELRQRLAEIDDLHGAVSVLRWDQQTQMPRGGAVARGDHMSTLGRIAHEKLIDPHMGEILDELKDYEASLPYESDDASIIRVTRRLYQKAASTPGDLIYRLSQAASRANSSWLEAREARDFDLFADDLSAIVELRREQADAMGYGDSPLDAFISMKESDITVAELEAMFEEFKTVIPPLVQAVADKDDPNRRRAPIQGHFPHQKQMDLGAAAARLIGFDLDRRGRLDLSVHPFSITFSPDDVRITTRVNENSLGGCLYSCIHEAGHGLYMQGVPNTLRQTLLDASTSRPEMGRPVSFGISESQSRLWENTVGRSLAFWEYFLPIARAFFPTQLAGTTPEDLYRATNVVQPSFVRVEADELTYNMHVMVRFELEKDVLQGGLAVHDMAEAWNEKMRTYLGVTPPHDTLGILQDMHWTRDFGGGFQGYALGDVFAASLFTRAQQDLSDLDVEWRQGDFSSLLSWMQSNLYDHGSKFGPQELIRRATGKGLDPAPYLSYLKEKFGRLYRI